MNSERWEQLESLFEKANRLPAPEQDAFIEAETREDPWLKERLQELLLHQNDASGFFMKFKSDIFAQEGAPTVIPETHSLVGQTIAHYQIFRKLGQGGMGEVYEGKDVRLDRPVALKFLSESLTEDTTARKRFLSEARASSALLHPNIATVFDVAETEAGRPYIAMECCLGGSLKSILEEKALTIDEVVGYAVQIATGLQVAHKAGIIHRDIKPGNLLFDSGGTLKIVDFGLARIDGQESLTQTGRAIGTAAYMAPEQVKAMDVDDGIDIWALGVVLYELLVGQRPFKADNPAAVLYAVTHKEPVPVSALRPGIPVQLQHVVAMALQKERAARYASVDDVLQDLIDVKEGRQTISTQVRMPQGTARFSNVAEQLHNPPPQDGAPLPILIVDDEPNVELLLRQFFSRRMPNGPWPLEFAENGKIALEKLDANPNISIVLTDIQMPEMDGLTLLRHLESRKRILKSVVISAYGDLKNIRQAMNLGAFDFITKPLEFEDLQRTVLKTATEVRRLQEAATTHHSLQTLKGELELAHSVQTNLLPPALADMGRIAIQGYLDATPTMQGDFYDYFWLDEDRLGFFIGDVSTDGFTSAIYMAMCRTLLKADAHRGSSPEHCMDALNRYLYFEYGGDFFITAFYGILNVQTGVLEYCNAGHNPPYHIKQGTDILNIEWDGSIGIGVEKEASYTKHQVNLSAGDTLLLVTDGLYKVINKAGELYTPAHIQEKLQSIKEEAPASLIRNMIRDMTAFSDGSEFPDDIALLALKYLG